MYPSMNVILVAAGKGRRIGGTPKALIDLSGSTILNHCLDTLTAMNNVQCIVIACVPGMLDEFAKATDGKDRRIKLVEGGAERQDSVEAAFRFLPAEGEIIAVHDAARPFATGALFLKTAEAALKYGAAVPILPVTDTIKMLEDGVVLTTPDRSRLGYVQTPQCFRRELFAAALASWISDGRPQITDDASMIERIGVVVNTVGGDRANIKITFPEDIATAAKELAMAGEIDNLRIGHGYDIHRTIAGRKLVLGGVSFDCGYGLLGHSDADVLAHAVCDALLGATAMGDIGRLFPDNDPRFKGADSMKLLGDVSSRIKAAGYRVVNLDCTIVAEKPRIAPAALEIAANLSACLGIEAARVSVKGKTNEKLGPEGLEEAISAHVVALLKKG